MESGSAEVHWIIINVMLVDLRRRRVFAYLPGWLYEGAQRLNGLGAGGVPMFARYRSGCPRSLLLWTQHTIRSCEAGTLTLGPLLIYITFAFNYRKVVWRKDKKQTNAGLGFWDDKLRLSGGHRFDKAAIIAISVYELESSGRFGVDIPVLSIQLIGQQRKCRY